MATAEPGVEDDRDSKIADVFVCKLRKKLEPLSIEIETLWGDGYRINPKTKRFIARLRSLSPLYKTTAPAAT